MYDFFTIDNFDLKGKTVGVRVDINSPILKGKVTLNERIIEHSKTIKDLSKLGARVVVLGHQGRKGKSDCISLESHSRLLSKKMGKNVKFSSDIYSTKTVSKIQNMKNGEILLLENLRFSDDEKEPYKKDNEILMLEELFDYYVFDAFSVAHREQTSVVGFSTIPNIAGRVMEKELKNLNGLLQTDSPHVYLFGGSKPDDLVELMETSLNNNTADMILLTGVIGELALYINGYNIGKKLDFMDENSYLDCKDKLKSLLKKFPDKIVLPYDVAVDVEGKRKEISIKDLNNSSDILSNNYIQDVGKSTVKRYSEILKSAGSIYVKGPAGNFELSPIFEYGTKNTMKAVVESKAFSFMGGGHTVTSAKMFGLLDKFSYVSLAGGALVHFLSGKQLPGIKTLEESYQNFSKEKEDFVVVGSNTRDMSVRLPEKFASLHLGDKVRIKEDFMTSIGGGGITVSACIKKLGGKVAYLGKISKENEEELKSYLSKEQIDIIKTKPTKSPCAKSVIVDTEDDDRIIFTYRGQNEELDIKDFDFSKISSKNFYFTSLSEKSFKTLIELSDKIRSSSGKLDHDIKHLICFNPSGYLIKSEKQIMKLIKNIDVLILNYEEAQMLINRQTSISNCLKEIKKTVSKVVIITNGSNGAYAYDGIQEYYEKAKKFSDKVYATGAGDSFAATFSYYYSKGYGTKTSMKYAAINSASVISKPGTQSGHLSHSEIQKKL